MKLKCLLFILFSTFALHKAVGTNTELCLNNDTMFYFQVYDVKNVLIYNVLDEVINNNRLCRIKNGWTNLSDSSYYYNLKISSDSNNNLSLSFTFRGMDMFYSDKNAGPNIGILYYKNILFLVNPSCLNVTDNSLFQKSNNYFGFSLKATTISELSIINGKIQIYSYKDEYLFENNRFKKINKNCMGVINNSIKKGRISTFIDLSDAIYFNTPYIHNAIHFNELLEYLSRSEISKKKISTDKYLDIVFKSHKTCRISFSKSYRYFETENLVYKLSKNGSELVRLFFENH